MPNRNTEGDYRYAYQGQEKDDETGMEAFELRLWDARIGRWLTTDPAGQFHSPYLGMGNDPINGIDPNGAWFGMIKAYWHKLWHGGSVTKNAHDKWVWSSGAGDMKGNMNSGFDMDVGMFRDFGYGDFLGSSFESGIKFSNTGFRFYSSSVLDNKSFRKAFRQGLISTAFSIKIHGMDKLVGQGNNLAKGLYTAGYQIGNYAAQN